MGTDDFKSKMGILDPVAPVVDSLKEVDDNGKQE